MSVLTVEQIQALNAFARTHPHLAKTFDYTASGTKEGLGDALNDSSSDLQFNPDHFYLTQDSSGNTVVNLINIGGSGGGITGVIFSDGTHTFTDDTLKFNQDQFYLTQDSSGNPLVNVVFPLSQGGSGTVTFKDGIHSFPDDTLNFSGDQFYLTTDSAGNPSVNVKFPVIITGQTPYFIPADETFIVEENKQVLYHRPIEVDGEIIIDGDLIQV